MSKNDKPLIVLSSFLPGDFFAGEILITSCMLESNNKIKTIALLDTEATEYLFINPSMVRRVCDKLQIKLIRLFKPKVIRGFDGQ